jgi:hypothetical protein
MSVTKASMPGTTVYAPTRAGDVAAGVPATTIFDVVESSEITINNIGYIGLPDGDIDTPANGEIVVDGATYPSGDILLIGPYRIEESVHYTGVNGDTGATATALATALDGLPNITASAVGDTVTFSYRVIQFGPQVFSVQNRVDPPNLSISSDDGYLSDQNMVVPVSLS